MKPKRLLLISLFCFGSLMNLMWAVPARPGWVAVMQPDSTTIEIQLVGDEWKHFFINREGKRVEQNKDGWWVEVKDSTCTENKKRKTIVNHKNKKSKLPL